MKSKTKKWLITSLCAAAVLTFGASTVYQGEADNMSKEEKLSNLKKDRENVKKALDELPHDKLDKQKELGHQLKDLDAQIGKLDKELHPNSNTQVQKLNSAFSGLRAGLEMTKELAEHMDVNDPKRAENLASVQEDFQMLDQIEKSYRDGTSSLQETNRKLDEFRAILLAKQQQS